MVEGERLFAWLGNFRRLVVPRKDHSTPSRHRPMPVDPKELARAMFRQADQKMFGGQGKKKPAQDAQTG